MYKSLLNNDVQEFITLHLLTDVKKLALKKNPFPEIDYKLILGQITSKQKAKEKLPTWFSTSYILYPEKISLEQTSSEKTAHYKSEIVSGSHLLDLTGGFGIDSFYFSKKMKNVTHCEINPELSMIAKHNFERIGIQNIECFTGDSSLFLKNYPQKFDWIYIDPSRRDAVKGKVFLLADCLPDVPKNLDYYFEHTNQLLIKVAPILDLTSAIKELKFVKNIHVVSVENEVKELLFELEKNYSGLITLKTIDFGKKITQFDSVLFEEAPDLSFSLPKKYLYEPNSAVMKSGRFELVSSRFFVAKLHTHSHLYTSEDRKEFPGRIFEIQTHFIYTKENLKHRLQNQKYNVTTRNFPETVENIRKKWNIKDGGNQYCFFTTDLNNQKIVLLCTKIDQL